MEDCDPPPVRGGGGGGGGEREGSGTLSRSTVRWLCKLDGGERGFRDTF